VYVVIGCVLVAGVVVGLGRADGVDVASIKMITFFGAWLACAVALLVLTIGFRLRIDEHGIWRRRFVRWDLWPWEAFERGRVRHGRFGDQLTYPEKPWYWRTMSASFLGEADRAAFETAVRKYRVPPPPPEVPEVLTLRCGLLRRVELSAEGVRAGLADHEGELIAWSDVDRAEVMRANHDRPDFVTLTLHLPAPAKPVRLSRREGQNWQGPDAEMIALYLQRHLRDDRFEVTALRGPPADAAEADRRLARLDRDERQYRMIGRFAGWALAVLAVVMLRPWEWPNPLNWGPADWVDVAINVGAAAVVIGLQGSMVLGVVYFHNRDIRRRREEVRSWKVARDLAVPESTN
jgi:membrane associated rhomboid family serine protease